MGVTHNQTHIYDLFWSQNAQSEDTECKNKTMDLILQNITKLVIINCEERKSIIKAI